MQRLIETFDHDADEIQVTVTWGQFGRVGLKTLMKNQTKNENYAEAWV